MGRRLALLARHAQVLVVTHLPQVAAFADRHVVVVKSSDGTVTTSGLTTLDDEGRVRELSRMLAGLEDSDTALAHAEELLRDRAAVPRRGLTGPTGDQSSSRHAPGRPPGIRCRCVSGLIGHEIPLAPHRRRRPARSDWHRPARPPDLRPRSAACGPVTSRSSTTSTSTGRPPRRWSTAASSPS